MTMEASSSQSVSLRSAERKAPSAFRTISEVATTLEVPAHVLRFWESKFQQVRPLKRGGGRRYYRPEDVDLLSNIKDLLYNQGFTIRGVQKLLREGKNSEVAASSVPAVPASVGRSASSAAKLSLSGSARREIESVLSELQSLRDLLRDNGI